VGGIADWAYPLFQDSSGDSEACFVLRNSLVYFSEPKPRGALADMGRWRRHGGTPKIHMYDMATEIAR